VSDDVADLEADESLCDDPPQSFCNDKEGPSGSSRSDAPSGTQAPSETTTSSSGSYPQPQGSTSAGSRSTAASDGSGSDSSDSENDPSQIEENIPEDQTDEGQPTEEEEPLFQEAEALLAEIERFIDQLEKSGSETPRAQTGSSSTDAVLTLFSRGLVGDEELLREDIAIGRLVSECRGIGDLQGDAPSEDITHDLSRVKRSFPSYPQRELYLYCSRQWREPTTDVTSSSSRGAGTVSLLAQMSRLPGHPFINYILGYFLDTNTDSLYFVTQAFPTTLRDLLKEQNNGQDLKQLLQTVIYQIGKALIFLRGEGYCHMKVSLDSVRVERPGRHNGVRRFVLGNIQHIVHIGSDEYSKHVSVTCAKQGVFDIVPSLNHIPPSVQSKLHRAQVAIESVEVDLSQQAQISLARLALEILFGDEEDDPERRSIGDRLSDGQFNATYVSECERHGISQGIALLLLSVANEEAPIELESLVERFRDVQYPQWPWVAQTPAQD